MENVTGEGSFQSGLYFRLLIIAALVAAIAAGGCGLSKPESPTWDTQLTVPLISHQYGMIELVDRMAEDALTYDSAGNISLNVRQSFDTVAVDAGLDIADLSVNFSEQLGEITIAHPAGVSSAILLADHIALGLGGEVPEASITETKDLPTISEFASATISSGSLVVTATNEFDLDLDSLTVAITDKTSGQPIGLAVFNNGLSIGETESRAISLSGRSISNSLSYTAYLHTGGGTLFTLADKQIGVEAGFSEQITVSSAVAKVAAQERSYSEIVSFNEDNRIDLASVKQGSLSLEITNSTNLPASVSIVVDQFEREGEPLVKNSSVAAHQTVTLFENLSDYDFTPLPGQPYPSVVVATQASITGSGSSTVQISSADGFAVRVSATGIALSSVEGVINPTEIEIASVTQDVDIPDGFENFSLKEAVMTIDIHSAVDLPAEVNLRIEGSDGQLLNIDNSITRGSADNPGLTQITISDLTDFLDPIPSQITISGTATVGDGATSGTVTENDFVCGEVQISSPLVMSIGETEFEADINEADMGDVDDEDVDRLRHWTVEAHLSNHLPIGASLELYLGPDTATLYSNPELVLGPYAVASGAIGANGLVSDTVGSSFSDELSFEDLQVLRNDPLYVGQVITFSGTEGQTVRIVSSDFMNVQAYIVIDVRVGESK